MNIVRYISGHKNGLFWLVSGLMLIAGVGILASDFATLWTKNHIQAFNREFEQALQTVDMANSNPDIAIAKSKQHIKAARAELDSLRPFAELAISLANGATYLPWVGEPAQQLVDLWAFTNETVDLSSTVVNIAELSMNSLKDGGLPNLFDNLPALQEHLRNAEAGFSKAQNMRNRLNRTTWMPTEIEAELKTALTRWDRLSPRLGEALVNANRVSWILATLLGDEKPSTYLLLIQSSDELRATGGFITGVGTIVVRRGKIEALTINDVLESEDKWRWTQDERKYNSGEANVVIPPPKPLMKYMGLGHWALRDANWYADFPSTAGQAAAFWELAKGTSVDGVIAVNTQTVENLLQVIGSIDSLEGRVIDANNLEETALSTVYQSDKSKALSDTMFLQELAFALVSLPEKLSSDKMISLGNYLQTAVARHDLLAVSFDPAINAVFHTLGVAGSLQGQQDDYFYLVEHNVSYNKLSPFIEQSLTYEVDLNPDASPIKAALFVDETNIYSPGAGRAGYPDAYYDGGRWNPVTRRVDHWPGYYGGYTRLYLPAESRVLEVAGFNDETDVGTENNRAVIGGYVGLQPGNLRQLMFRWIPGSSPRIPGKYRLVVQRQPGSLEHALTVKVNLPKGYNVAEITPTPLSVEESTVIWQAVLDRDQIFSLQLVPGKDLPVMAAVAKPPAPVISSVTPAPQIISNSIPSAVVVSVPGRPPKPSWLNIPAISVSSPVISVGLEPSGIMASPDEADVAGWFELGPRPGEASNSIISGHVNWKGETGIFSKLYELKLGDIITVQSGAGIQTDFVVDSLQNYQADIAPLEEIFGSTTESILTLITCSGTYDSQQQLYKDRLVVRAYRR